MRSLEEWLAYVESQAEEARKRLSQKAQPVAGNAPEADASGSVEAAPAVVHPEAATAQPKPIRAEGRALMTWETTLPVDLPHGESSRLEPPAVYHAEPAVDHGPNGAAADASAAHPGVPPLTPYESKDPRWRSSVDPVRQQVDIGARDVLGSRDGRRLRNGASPASIPLPYDADEASCVSENTESPSIEVGPPTEPAAPSIATSAPLGDRSAPEEAQADGISAVTHDGPAIDAPPQAAAVDVDGSTRPSTKRARRITARAAKPAPASPPAPAATPVPVPCDSQALWDRVPRHVQALIRSQANEVAQNSYKKGFRETREALIQRLLDPELTLEESARILGVCPTTVRRYTNRGLLPHHRTPGNQRRFRLSHVLEFMEQYGGAGGIFEGPELLDGEPIPVAPEASMDDSGLMSGARS